jgi:hypothetical protein
VTGRLVVGIWDGLRKYLRRITATEGGKRDRTVTNP